MTVREITRTQHYTGLSTDTKPTGVPVGSTFWEWDTKTLYITPDGTNWSVDIAADISFDSDSIAEEANNTLTWAHTIGDGQNRILIVVCPISETAQGVPNSVTYGGVPLTQAVGEEFQGTGAYIYYLVNPAVGIANIIITYSQNRTHVGRAASFFGVSQLSPVGATNTVDGTAQNKSLALTTTATGSILIDCIGAASGTHQPTAGQTSLGNVALYVNRAGSRRAVAAIQSYTNTWSSDGSNWYAMVIVEFKKATRALPYSYSKSDPLEMGVGV